MKKIKYVCFSFYFKEKILPAVLHWHSQTDFVSSFNVGDANWVFEYWLQFFTDIYKNSNFGVAIVFKVCKWQTHFLKQVPTKLHILKIHIRLILFKNVKTRPASLPSLGCDSISFGVSCWAFLKSSQLIHFERTQNISTTLRVGDDRSRISTSVRWAIDRLSWIGRPFYRINI